MKNTYYFTLFFAILFFIFSPSLFATEWIKFQDGTNFGPFTQGCSNLVNFTVEIGGIDNKNNYNVIFLIKKYNKLETKLDSFVVSVYENANKNKYYASISNYEAGLLPDSASITAYLRENNTQRIAASISHSLISSPFPLNIKILSEDDDNNLYYQMRTDRNYKIQYRLGDQSVPLKLSNLQIDFTVIDSSGNILRTLETLKDSIESVVNIAVSKDYEIPFGSIFRINIKFDGSVTGGINYDIHFIVIAPEISTNMLFPYYGFKTNNWGKALKQVWTGIPVPSNIKYIELTNLPWRTKCIVPTILYLNNKIDTLLPIYPLSGNYFKNKAVFEYNFSNWPLDARTLQFRFLCEGIEDGKFVSKEYSVFAEPNYSYQAEYKQINKTEFVTGFQQRNPKNDWIPTIDQSLGNIIEIDANLPASPIDSFEVAFLNKDMKKLKSFYFKKSLSKDNIFKQTIDISAVPYTAKWVQTLFHYQGGNPLGFLNDALPINISVPAPNVNISEQLFSQPIISNIVENHFYSLSNINSSVGQIDFEIFNVDNIDVLHSKSFTSSSGPYKNWLELNGRNTKIEMIDTISRVSDSLKKYFNGTLSAYFKTSSNKGGPIASLEIQSSTGNPAYPLLEISILKDGSLQGSIAYKDADNSIKVKKFTTPHKYNNGEWHFVNLVRDDKILKIYVDGEFAADDELCPQCSSYFAITSQGKLKFNIGSSSFEDANRGLFFAGSLSGVAFWKSPFKLSNIANYFYSATEVLDTLISNNSYFYFPLSNLNQLQTSNNYKDYSISTYNITNGSFKRDNRFVGVGYTFATGAAEPGNYDVFVVQTDKNTKDETTSRIGTLKIVQPQINILKKPASADTNILRNFTITADEGFGPFSQIYDLFNNFTIHYKTSKTDLMDKLKISSFYVALAIVDSSNKNETQKTTTEEKSSSTSIDFRGANSLNMALVPNGGYLKVIISDKTTISSSTFAAEILFPIKLYGVPPVIIEGNFGPFTQSILPNLNPEINTFTITTPSEFFDSAFVVFKDQFANIIDTVKCTRDNPNSKQWKLDYNMAELIPPQTTGEVYILKDGIIKSQTDFVIEIIPTRPLFMQGNEVDITNITNIGNGKYTFDYNRIIGLESDISGQKQNLALMDKVIFYILGGSDQNSLTLPSRLKINITYDSLSGQFTKTEGKTPKITSFATFMQDDQLAFNILKTAGTLQFYILKSWYRLYDENKLPEILRLNCMFSLESDIKNEAEIELEDNELTVTSLKAKRTGIELSFKNANKWLEEVTKAADLIKKLGKTGEIIAPKIDLDLFYRASIANNIRYAKVEEKWGPAGDINIDADSKNNSSFNISSLGMGLNLNLGATVLSGLLEVYLVIGNAIDIAWGKSWNMEFNRDLFSAGYTLSLGIKSSIGWGFFSFWILKPHILAHPSYGDRLYPWYSSRVVEGEKGIVKNNLDNVLYSAELLSPQSFPHPDADEFNGTSCLSWVEQNFNNGFGSLKLAIKNKNDNLFNKSISIEDNYNSISNPTSTIINDSIAVICWEQLRLNKHNINSIDSTINLSDLLYSQDIWAAVFDYVNNEILFKGIITDKDTSSFFGIAEAQPQITRLDNNHALIAWLSKSNNKEDSEIKSSVLKYNNLTWEIEEPVLFGNTTGNETKLQLHNDGNGKAIAVWLSDYTHQNSEKQEIMSSSYDISGGKYDLNTVVATNKDNHRINHIDFELKNKKGGLVTTNYYYNNTSKTQFENVALYEYNDRFSTLSTVIYQDTGKHHFLPQIAISPSGKSVIMFNQFINQKDNSNIHFHQNKIFGGTIGSNTSWKQLNSYITNSENLFYKSEIKFIGADTLLVLSNEREATISNVATKPLNGSFIGAPSMNLVARMIHIHDSVTTVMPELAFTNLSTASLPEISVFPNPPEANSTISINSAETQLAEICLVDLRGELIYNIYSGNLPSGISEFKYDFNTLNSGIYFITIKTPKGINSCKVIVSK